MNNSAADSQKLGGNGNSFSPIQILHPDLLCEIFKHCLSHPNNLDGSLRLPRPSITEAPLKLGRICSWWRKLVLDTSLLWSQLSLGGRNPSSGLKALVEWLIRSRQAKLWLSTSYTTTSFADQLGELNEIIEIIISHHNRWQYLDLRLPPALEQHIFDNFPNHSTNLKILRIKTDCWTSDGPFYIDLSRLVFLTDLTLHVTCTRFMSNHVTMHHIRTLDMDLLTIHDYFQCLDLCPSAEDVRFRFQIVIDFSASIDQEIRILPSIRTLSLQVSSLEYDAQYDIGPFLNRLQLPSLSELEFWPGILVEKLEGWTHLSNLLMRSGQPPLKTLKVSPMPMEEFCNCLCMAPKLEVLLAAPSLFVNPTLDTLTRRSNPGQYFVCPRLRQLEVLLYGGDPLDAGCAGAAEFVLKRWSCTEKDANPSRICTIVLKIMEEHEVDRFLSYPGIHERVKDGLLITSCDGKLHEIVYTYDHSKFSSADVAEWKLRWTKNKRVTV